MRIILALVVASVFTVGLVAMGSELCFYKSEKQSQSNKICYYSCPSGDAAFTVKSYELCPLNIKR